MALNELESFDSATQAKRNLRAAIEKVASRLGNTPTICRKCYVHPEVLSSYMDGNLVLEAAVESPSRHHLRGDAFFRISFTIYWGRIAVSAFVALGDAFRPKSLSRFFWRCSLDRAGDASHCVIT
jgi:hypothetical protein